MNFENSSPTIYMHFCDPFGILPFCFSNNHMYSPFSPYIWKDFFPSHSLNQVTSSPIDPVCIHSTAFNTSGEALSMDSLSKFSYE